MKLNKNAKTGHYECPKCRFDLQRAAGKGRRDPETGEMDYVPIWYCTKCKIGIPEDEVDE